MRILALDVGDKQIGVALSDPTGLLASALTTVRRTGRERDLAAIAGLVREHEVELVVVGLPRTLRGEVGPQAERVQAFAAELAGVLPVPIELWDERLSTVGADRLMVEGGVRRGERRERIDAAAAAFILQGYLDARRRPGPEGTGQV